MLLNNSSFGFGGTSMFSGGTSPQHRTANSPQVYDQSPLNQLNLLLSNASISYRCIDLQTFINRTPLEELKKCYPIIVNSIFGFGPHLGWGLRSISRRDMPGEAENIQRLLGPEGPMVQLSYRLMFQDPHLRYEFPLRSLPVSIERKISQNDIPAYFPKNIKFKYASITTPYAVLLNPFEYFLYVFSSVLVGARPEQNSYMFGWHNLTESVYSNLVEEFLQYFLPTNGRAVPGIQQEESPPRPGLQYSSHLMPRHRLPGRFSLPVNSPGPKIPKLFRPTILDDENYILASRNMSLSQEHSPMERENWRSETMVSAFIIMWMHIDSAEGTMSAQFETILPNIEVVKCVRMIVRHFHFFNNMVNTSVLHPLEEIKKFLFPFFQRRLYVFLRYLFKHWPMDNSFRIVYETWLSYIQPWRYMSQDGGVVRDREELQIDQRWSEFLTDNMLFYTYLLQDLLIRIAKSDLTIHRNAHMVFRITKIFTSQKIIKPTLKNLDSSLTQLSKPPPFSNVASPSALKKRGNAKINLNASAYSPRRVSFNDNSFSAANTSGDSYVGQISPSPHAVSSSKLGKLGYFKELEDTKFGYTPLFSPVHRDLVRDIIQNMQKARDFCVHSVAQPVTTRNRQGQTLNWFKSLFSSQRANYGPTPTTGSEKEKVIQLLDLSRGALAGFFDIMLPEEINGGYDTTQGMNLTNGSDLSPNTTVMTPRPSPALRQPKITFFPGYRGNPDYAPYRSDENVCAVRFLDSISKFLNTMIGPLIREKYLENDAYGKITRAVVAKPQFYETLIKRGPGDSTRVRKCLAPRILLRPFGSTTAILNVLGFILLGFLIGLESYGWVLVPLIIFVFYVFIRVYFEPIDNLAKLRQEFDGYF